MSRTGETDLDVLIVGAGPVGLFLANECARRSLRWRIVEQRARQSEHSKALAVFPRSLEILDMAGLVGPFLEEANRVTSVSVFAHGQRLTTIPFSPVDSPYPFVAMVPQDVTERLLIRALQQRGGAVLYETTFVSAAQEESSVAVELEHHGGRRTARAAFLVGCDGAHSAVRHGLHLPFEGAQYRETFILADVDTNPALPGNELQLCPHEAGPVAIFPMSSTRRRIVATVDAPNADAPTLGIVNALLRQRGPRDIVAHALHWSSYFGVHHRQVAHLREGRILLAGDAAHIHSPFGGQGMNTGFQDAWNLAWKLAYAARGRARPVLLESYTAERRPVIRQVIRTTDRITKVMGSRGRVAQALRDLAIPVVSRLRPFQRAFVHRLSQLGVTYSNSPIIRGAGRRYFDDSLRRGGIGDRFVLVVGPDTATEVAAAAQRLGEALPDLVEVRTGHGSGIALVRPDGYTAYEGRRATMRRVQSIRDLLERQAVSQGKTGVGTSALAA
jgi:2-polyprenyl-6-methoxyphenol hydroxylase-like FAD-dependent oxidoreductase